MWKACESCHDSLRPGQQIAHHTSIRVVPRCTWHGAAVRGVCCSTRPFSALPGGRTFTARRAYPNPLNSTGGSSRSLGRDQVLATATASAAPPSSAASTAGTRKVHEASAAGAGMAGAGAGAAARASSPGLGRRAAVHAQAMAHSKQPEALAGEVVSLKEQLTRARDEAVSGT